MYGEYTENFNEEEKGGDKCCREVKRRSNIWAIEMPLMTLLEQCS